MKKYLMTGIAALAMGGMFTSCSHDMSLYNGDGTKAVVDKYEQAFVDAYGEPDANQTWGFGEISVAGTRGMTRSVGTYADYKGTMQPVVWAQDKTDWQWKWMPYTFPSDCDASNFTPDLDGVNSYKEVADAANQGGGFATGICYIDENHTGKVHIWGGNERAKLYFKAGTFDFTNETFDLCQNADLYLLNGATLTLNNSAASTVKFNIYIASGAKLIVNGADGLRLDNGAKVYNHGEIETTKCEVNTTSMLYNVGTLTASDVIWVANNYSIIVNDGTMTSGNSTDNNGALKTLGSGRFQNNAEVTVYGKTIVNSNDNMWVNNGHYKTQYFEYTATSSSVINNCLLEVTEDFLMNISDGSGDFKVDAGGGVLTKNFYGGGVYGSYNGGPYKITMGSGSVFKVTNEAHLNALGSGIATAHYGFEGVGDDYAVFQAKKVSKDGKGHGNVAYTGNIYVSAEEHFAQESEGYSDGSSAIIFANGCSEANIYAPVFQSGTPDITINTTPCNPGFGNSGSEGGEGGGETVDPVTESIRVIAEDLSASQRSDFDFNDVVFDVFWTHTPGNDDKSTQSVKLKIYAAGGELPIFIGYADDPAWELHALLEAVNPDRGITTKTMMNTYAGQHHSYNYREVDLPNDAWEGSEIGPIAKSINIYVRKSGTTYPLTAEKGEAACKIAVGTNYEWCNERQDIDVKYNGKFKRYVDKNIDESLKLGDDWYESYIE